METIQAETEMYCQNKPVGRRDNREIALCGTIQEPF